MKKPQSKGLLVLGVLAVALAVFLGLWLTANTSPVYADDGSSATVTTQTDSGGTGDSGALPADCGTGDSGTATDPGAAAPDSGATADSGDTVFADCGSTIDSDSAPVDEVAPVAETTLTDCGTTDSGSLTATNETAVVNGSAPVNVALPSEPTQNTAIIQTNKQDYSPLETPVIAGSGFAANSQVTIVVTTPQGNTTLLTANTDERGEFTLNYEEALTKGQYSISATDGQTSASNTFTDARSVNITNWSVSDITPDWAKQGATKIPILTFTARSSYSDEKLLDLQVTYTGSSTSDIATMYLYSEYDVSGGTFDPLTDIQMASATTPSSGVYTLDPPDFSMTAGISYQFYIVVDLAATVPEQRSGSDTTIDARIATDAINFQSGTWPSSNANPSGNTRIDNTIPTITYNSPAAGGQTNWYSSSPGNIINIDFGWVGRSPLDYAQWQIGSGSWNYIFSSDRTSDYTSNWGITWSALAQGNNQISIRVADTAGNVLTHSYVANTSGFLFRKDTTPPTITYNSPAAGGQTNWYSSDPGNIINIDFGWVANSPLDYAQWQIGSGNWNDIFTADQSSNYTTNWGITWTALAEGDNQISIRVADTAGNVLTHSYAANTSGFLFRKDTTPPTITYNSPAAGGQTNWYSSDPGNIVDIDFGWVANSPLDYARWRIGSGSWNNIFTTDQSSDYTTDWGITWSALAQGDNQISIMVADKAGNVLTHSYMANTSGFLFRKDTTPPVVTATASPSPNAAGWNNTDVTVTFSATDALSGVATLTPPVTVTTEGSGQIVNGSATDNAGNVASVSVTLNIDKTPPVVTITNPAPGTYGTPQTLVYTTTDALSGIASVTGPASDTVYSTPGDYVITITAIDNAGNEGSASVTFTIIVPIIPAMTEVAMHLLVIDWFGVVRSFLVNQAGVLLEDVEITSPDGTVTLIIAAGSQVLDENGNPLYLRGNPAIIATLAQTPQTPEGTIAAYQFNPSGVTFSKPAQLVVKYDTNKVAEGDVVVIAYYDEAAGKWVEMETFGYIAAGKEVANTVNCNIFHTTYFAILAKVPAK